MVYTEEQLIQKLNELKDGTKKGAQLCSALIESHTHEIEIKYIRQNGRTTLHGFQIIDCVSKQVVQDHNGAYHESGKFRVDLPRALAIDNAGLITIYGCGSVINGKFKFKVTDFTHSLYTIGHYSDRIILLKNWGFDPVQVDAFPVHKASEWVMNMRRNFPAAYGLFVTRDLQEQGAVSAPFFISFK